MANKKLGSILREYRQKKDYTQQDVANILHLKNKSTLGSWEVGKSEPDAVTFLKLCDLYDIPDILEVFIGITNQKDSIELSKPIEILLLKNFRSLNEIGKQKVVEYISDLKENSKYTKPQEAESDNFPEFQIAAYDGDGVETGKANATYEELKKLFDDM